MKYLPILFTLLSVTSLIAQNAFDVSTIENPELGKCYVKYVIDKPQYDTIYEKVVLLENNPDLVPYCEVVEEQIMVSPPIFKKIQGYQNDGIITDTIYEFDEKNIIQFKGNDWLEIKPPSESLWMNREIREMNHCSAFLPNDVVILCLVEVPNQYEQIVKRIGDSIILKRTEPIVTHFKRTEVWAEITSTLPKYKIIQMLVPRKPLRNKLLQKARYSTIIKIVESQPIKLSEWQELICGTNCPSYSIKDLQRKLVQHGYRDCESCVYSGLNADTKKHLLKFQKDRRLIEGIINFQTLKELKKP